MNAPKFTPGPWTIRKDGDGGYAFVEIIGANNMQVAQLESASGFDVETEADAHLIAAAPELLETARRLVAFADSIGHTPGECSGDDRCFYCPARSALAKAVPS